MFIATLFINTANNSETLYKNERSQAEMSTCYIISLLNSRKVIYAKSIVQKADQWLPESGGGVRMTKASGGNF